MGKEYKPGDTVEHSGVYLVYMMRSMRNRTRSLSSSGKDFRCAITAGIIPGLLPSGLRSTSTIMNISNKRDLRFAYSRLCRFGSETACRHVDHVRFTPQSGQARVALKCPLLRVRCKAVAFKPTRTFEIDWTIPGVTPALSACRRPLHRHLVESGKPNASPQ